MSMITEIPPEQMCVFPFDENRILDQNADYANPYTGIDVFSRSLSFDEVEDQIANIRTVFDLTIREIATIIGISKYEIYDWINHNSLPTRQTAQFLKYIEDVIRFWSQYSDQYLTHKYVFREIDGVSIYSLLAEQKTQTEFQKLFETFATEINNKPITLINKKLRKNNEILASIPTVSYWGEDD